MNNVKLDTAILLLKRGQPLPVDLETELMAQGIDVDALKNDYEL